MFLSQKRPFIISLHPMKRSIYILLILIGVAASAHAQERRRVGDGRSFSLSNLTKPQGEVPDSLLVNDSILLKTKGVTAFRLSPFLGEPYIAPMDTNQLNFANSTNVESNSLSVGYLANVGSPTQTRIFNERPERRDFIFADPFNYDITTPENALFYDTKVPYTNILYIMNGGEQKKEERLKAVLTVNFGKKINIGGDVDYIYTRGHYNSNGNKQVSYRLFGSYLSDRYEMHAYLSNYNIVAYENGGLTNDAYVTDPDSFRENKRETDTKDYPVRYTDAFNRVRGKQYFLTHRYNLGYYRTLDEADEEGNEIEKFIPVSSIIHTLAYEDNRRHFTGDTAKMDPAYTRQVGDSIVNWRYNMGGELHDRPSAWNLKNTVALSLREGFQDWVKFGLSAFVTLENRSFKMMPALPGLVYNEYNQIISHPPIATLPTADIYKEFSTYIGAELSKRQGSILTYNARGELCLVGDDVGEFRLTGNLKTRFPLLKKEASVEAEGYIKNVTPAFFMRHYHSRYFWWDNKFKNEQYIYAGAKVNIESTRTQLSAGVNSIQSYTYFGTEGVPEQYDGNLQVVTARIKQDFRYRAFGWENEAAYQVSSNDDVIPLPKLSLYSNMYLDFRLVKVLRVQLGADVHYFSSYYAPYYEPATQQFQLQPENDRKVKVGNYPLITAYANFHLKQARFFISGYNIGTMFLDPKHFSLPHYPLNPFVLKFGIAVRLNN